jgi:hypothetical protein
MMYLVLLFLSATAHAAGISMVCATNPISTAFVIETKGEEVQARVIHFYGANYAPAISGTFTPSDLPLLARRAGFIAKMKDDTTFRWPLKKCKSISPERFECFGSDDKQEGKDGTLFEPFALYSTKVVEDGIVGKQENLRLTLSLYSGEEEGVVEMSYSKEDCSADPARAAAFPKK